MITLVILDGFGERKEKFGNAIKSQGTPYLDKLKKEYPHTILKASGLAVGLPEGQMGNSEVGHLTIGAGRVILQDLQHINTDIESGKFYENPALIKALAHAEKNNSALHIMGLFSNGGVHSELSHMYAILDFAKNYNIKNIFIHAFLDGRDTGVKDGRKFLQEAEEKIKGTNASIATLIGRVYAMDREKRFDRLEKAYRLLTEGEGRKFNSSHDAIEKMYDEGITDEFMEPCVINENGKISDNDSVIFFNYRTDRAIELTTAFTKDDFKEFKTKRFKNLLFTTMTEYSADLKDLNILYPPIIVEDNLASIISQNGLSQFHTSETTKYAHVTFFINGGIEKPYPKEDRKLIDSINVKDFSKYPKMRAMEITEAVVEAIHSMKYDYILVNFSNPDMIGHTGNFESTKEAIKCVDKCAYTVALATLMVGGECLITADHGNAEEMIDEKGNKVTTHTTNPVPFILVSKKNRKVKLKKGKSLTSIAPTVLKLLNITPPSTYDEPLF